MDYFKELISNKYASEKKLYTKLQARLVKLARYEGDRLDYSSNSKRKTSAYYIHHADEPANVRHYCNKSHDADIKNIQEYRYLKEAVKIIESNMAALQNLLASYQSPYPNDVVKTLGTAYQNQDQIKSYLFGSGNSGQWLKSKQAAKDEYFRNYPVIHPEGLTQNALDGTPTRSKSELNIYDFLYSNGFTFIYEMPVLLNGNWYIVDFMVLLPNGRVIIIEHMGLTNNHSYMDRKMHVIENFIQSGWIPNVNLIVTYEDINGNIDMQAIARQIYAFCD